MKTKLAKYLLDTELDLLYKKHGEGLFKVLFLIILLSISNSLQDINNKIGIEGRGSSNPIKTYAK